MIEAKSGSAADRHRSDLYWYALVATLRHRRPPSLCATWTAGDGGLVPVPVSLGRRWSLAAQRGLDALGRLVALVGGRRPEVAALRRLWVVPGARSLRAGPGSHLVDGARPERMTGEGRA